MNALRNFICSRTLSYLRQSGPNVLINYTQPVDAKQSGTNSIAENDINSAEKNRIKPLLIPKSILDATTFTVKNFNESKPPGSLSPTTIKRFRSIERKVELVYLCKLCNTRNAKLVTEAAYTSGVVILQCDGCAINHLIIDNLGWFANTKGKSFDDVLAEQGNRVKVIKVNEYGDLI